MALLAILLSVVAFGCMVLGFLTTPIPVVGLVFSFGAAAIALTGMLVGGRALSRAKRETRPTDAAWIAVILNLLAFIPALLVAFTCGVCNALVSSGGMHVQRQVDLQFGQPGAAGEAAPPLEPGPNEPERPGEPPKEEPGAAPDAPQGLPPPPLPAGPRSH